MITLEDFIRIYTEHDPSGGRKLKITTNPGVDDPKSFLTKSDPVSGRAIKVNISGFNPIELDKLKNNEYKITYFTEINSATGTITIPTGASIQLDQFEGGIDAFVTSLESGKPSGVLPKTSLGANVDVASFDAMGNYTLTGTPSDYPVALIYVLKIKAIDYENLDPLNIIEEYRLNSNNNLINRQVGEFLIEANRLVVASGSAVVKYNQSNDNHYGKYLGLTVTSSSSPGFVDILTDGEVETGLVLTPGSIYYASTNGNLTDIPPVSGIIHIVGIALSSSKLLLVQTQPMVLIGGTSMAYKTPSLNSDGEIDDSMIPLPVRDKFYEQSFTNAISVPVPASTHGFDRKPDVSIVNPSGNPILANVTYAGYDITVTFNRLLSGTIILT